MKRLFSALLSFAVIVSFLNLWNLEPSMAQSPAPTLCNVGDNGNQLSDPQLNAETFQACIDAAKTGDIIELRPGEYPMQKPIIIATAITLRTQGLASSVSCGDDRGLQCAHLIAVSPLINIQRAFIQIQSPNVTLAQIVVDGNKSARTSSPEAQACRAGNNGLGITLHVNAPTFKFLGSSTINALCGSGMEITPASSHLEITNSFAGFNGVHNQNMLWSDGITILQSDDAIIRGNLLTDNTDVDLIFGGCTRCQITGNQIKHSDTFAQSSFAALMLHAWPNGSTSGDYSGSNVSDNQIDCSAGHQCGFGILIGANPWYKAPTFGGTITDNTINGAQGGLIVNDATGDITLGPNTVTNSGGIFKTSQGKKNLSSYGISIASKPLVHFINGANHEPWQSRDFTGAIPNWWQ